MTEYIWLGPDGHTPGLGDTITGQRVVVPEGLIKILLDYGRIQAIEVKKNKTDTPMSKVKEDR